MSHNVIDLCTARSKRKDAEEQEGFFSFSIDVFLEELGDGQSAYGYFYDIDETVSDQHETIYESVFSIAKIAANMGTDDPEYETPLPVAWLEVFEDGTVRTSVPDNIDEMSVWRNLREIADHYLTDN